MAGLGWVSGSCPCSRLCPTLFLSLLCSEEALGAGEGAFISAVGVSLPLQVTNISISQFNNKLVTLHLKLLKMQNPLRRIKISDMSIISIDKSGDLFIKKEIKWMNAGLIFFFTAFYPYSPFSCLRWNDYKQTYCTTDFAYCSSSYEVQCHLAHGQVGKIDG